MRVIVKAERYNTVGALSSRGDLELATDSQDVQAIHDHFGNRPAVTQFDGFLVKAENGDYEEVYGFHGSVPGTQKWTYRVTMEYLPDKPGANKRAARAKPKKQKGTKKSDSQLGGIR
jgi:hypothetical protein